MQFWKQFILLFIVSELLCSCFSGTTKHLDSGQFSKTFQYRINRYASGCCGCVAEYADIIKQGDIQEQIVYKYNCYSAGMPTKFVFNYDEYGLLLYCNKLIATTGNDVTVELTEEEKKLFSILDAKTYLVLANKIIKFSSIKGFRQVSANDVSHPYVILKNKKQIIIK
jgi:hypothetical protein